MKKTANELIHIGNPIPFDTDAFLLQLRQLMAAAYDNDASIYELVAEMVSTYHRAGPFTEPKMEACKLPEELAELGV